MKKSKKKKKSFPRSEWWLVVRRSIEQIKVNVSSKDKIVFDQPIKSEFRFPSFMHPFLLLCQEEFQFHYPLPFINLKIFYVFHVPYAFTCSITPESCLNSKWKNGLIKIEHFSSFEPLLNHIFFIYMRCIKPVIRL